MFTLEELKLLSEFNSLDLQFISHGDPDFSEYECPHCGACKSPDDLPGKYCYTNDLSILESYLIHADGCRLQEARDLIKKINNMIKDIES